MPTQDRDYAMEIFHNKVLEALDRAAEEVFGNNVKTNCAGAMDADLPLIFPAIDEQVERLAARYSWPLFENYVGTERWKQNRQAAKDVGLPVIEDSAAEQA